MELFRAALTCHQAGDLNQAERLYKQFLKQHKNNNASVMANLGLLYLQRSKPNSDEFLLGISTLEKSLKINPYQAQVLNNLGNAWVAVGKINCADACYLDAIKLAPNYLDAYKNRALLLRDRFGEEQAIDWLYKSGIGFDKEPSFWIFIGVLWLDQDNPNNALVAFDKAIEIAPTEPVAWYNRGNALRLLRRLDEALVSYKRCLRLQPAFLEALINMGVTLHDLKLHEDAIRCYDTALQLRPSAISACYNRALALENIGNFVEAVAAYNRTLELSPTYPFLIGRRHHARMQMCDWLDYLTQQQQVCAAVGSGLPASVPFSFLAMSDDVALQRKCAETYARDMFPAATVVPELKRDHSNRRIRVGYFSADFRTHAVGFLTAGLFKNHDRVAFEIFAVSLGGAPESDPYRRRIADAVEHFIDAGTMADADVVELARSLELDIAVDLAGHTMDARTGIFAQRVATVQVNYLGYPGSMGAPYMDVTLADDVVIPFGAETEYTEQVIRLPHTFQINDDQRQIGELQTRSSYGLLEQGLVFASFNTSYKIIPPLFDIWCRLLQAVPGSVLWLFGENEAQITNLRREASSRGVLPERLLFAGRIAYADHLARYAHVDLVLDTLPFNGGTSTSDALWGGAPVLTCMGKSFAGRMSASLLRAVGLSELITESLEAYEALGKELASDASRLAGIKVKLQANRLQCPLFDTKSQTRDIESAYREMLLGRD